MAISFEETAIPIVRTRQQYQRDYKTTLSGRIARHKAERQRESREYLERPFIAWDGEGINLPDGSHSYVLLANSQGARIQSRYGLPMARCFDTLLASAARNPDAIHVIYGGGYDTNMMLGELTREELERVYRSPFPVPLHGYRVRWRPGKNLWVSDGERSVTLYDVISFFQCSFVAACDKYLGRTWLERDLIVETKALRGKFTFDDITSITSYNDAELTNLVRLMTELRLRLDRVGLRLRRWDGPGAIASVVLTTHHIKAYKSERIPQPVAKAARHAYAGGRFEVVKFGRSQGPVYAYDIRSAYPAAMRELPALAGGEWSYVEGDPGVQQFALYHLVWKDNGLDAGMEVLGPLFHRAHNGTIYYPTQGSGWYWTPEYQTAMEYARTRKGRTVHCKVAVVGAWVFTPASSIKPFQFVEAMYEQRRELKANGDGAEMGLKLALNSLYGKTAQQVGWRYDRKGNVRIPPYHQLEWAGYITSHARATVLQAAMLNLPSVIAFETDALFTSERLPLPLSEALGGWEETVYQDLTYLQSGIYFATGMDGSTVTSKTRGLDLGVVTREQAEAKLTEGGTLEADFRRFVGAGIALTQNFDRWRRWETLTKQVTLEPTGKRAHYPDGHCQCPAVFALDRWHKTACLYQPTEISAEYPVAWINPNPEMAELDQLRLAHYEEDY